jgi:RNA recognition motif-containing protein
MSNSVQVANIAQTTTKDHLDDFFTFCGKITSIDLKDTHPTKSAIIHFEKPQAAKTALMLNGGLLDGSNLQVTSDTVKEDESHHDEAHPPPSDAPFEQSDKPRAAIAAEYLAKGYALSDQILSKAIDLDKKHGISNRFLSYITSVDKTVGAKVGGPDQTVSGKVQSALAGASTRARSMDEQRGISKQATSYYKTAFESPFGQKVFAFYSTTAKQVQDIHEEARRMADAQKQGATTAPTATATAPAPTTPPPSEKKE